MISHEAVFGYELKQKILRLKIIDSLVTDVREDPDREIGGRRTQRMNDYRLVSR